MIDKVLLLFTLLIGCTVTYFAFQGCSEEQKEQKELAQKYENIIRLDYSRGQWQHNPALLLMYKQCDVKYGINNYTVDYKILSDKLFYTAKPKKKGEKK